MTVDRRTHTRFLHGHHWRHWLHGGETSLARNVAQKAGSGVVVDGSCAGLGVQVETPLVHHEVADDLGSSTRGEDHGLALAPDVD
jgi:hypothetical protein